MNKTSIKVQRQDLQEEHYENDHEVFFKRTAVEDM